MDTQTLSYDHCMKQKEMRFMFYVMGPIHNREFEEENDSVDRMSQPESKSRCSTPDYDSPCLQSPRSTFSCPGLIQHEPERHHTDAWMGYSPGIWPRQHDTYQEHHSHQHPLNLHQQQQQLQPLSSSSSWHDTSTLTSVGGNVPTYKTTSSTETLENFSQASSTNQCDSQPHHQNAARQLPTSSHTGLVSLNELTEPVDIVSGTNCIPLSEECIKYSLDQKMSNNVKVEGLTGNTLKRKLPFSLRKSDESPSGETLGEMCDEARAEKRRRFARTTEALKKLGLWEVAIRTGKMIVRNRQFQKELDELRQESRQLMISVLKNPENLKRALVTMKARIKAHKEQSFHNCNVPVQS